MLSIIVPSIRPQNLQRLFTSIRQNFSGVFELIVVSPYPLPDELVGNEKIKYIYSKASPTVCLQLGLLSAQYKYTTWFSDDSYYLNDSLNKCVNFLKNYSYNTIVSCKYTESDNPNEEMNTDKYYQIGYACFGARYVPANWWLLNFAVCYTSYLKQLGGFDCYFQTTIFSVTDFAVRAQRDGAKITLLDLKACHSDHEAGLTGTHAPVAISFEEDDVPLWKEIYNQPESVNRINIELDNYKQQSEVWSRRFS